MNIDFSQTISRFNKLTAILLRIVWLIVLVSISSCNANHTVTPIASYVTPTQTYKLIFPPITPSPPETPVILPAEAAVQWLKGVPCEPPCWEGITPGVTTYSDVEKAWNENSLFTHDKTITMGPLSNNPLEKNYFKVNTSGHFEVLIESPGNPHLAPVQRISVQNFYAVKLNDVIQAFGQPSHIIVQIIPGFEGSTKRWFLHVIWVEKGLALLSQGLVPVPNINSNVPVEHIDFFAPGLKGFWQAEFWNNALSEVTALLRPWHGYDSYNGYYDQPTPTP